MTVTATTGVQGRLGPAQAGPALSALLERFPARPTSSSWAASTEPADRWAARLSVPPFTATGGPGQARRRNGVAKVFGWLEGQEGDSWQERWLASGADEAGNIAWRHLASQQLGGRGQPGRGSQAEFIELGRAMLILLGADVIRPSLTWLVTPGGVKGLAAEMAAGRDPAGFAVVAGLADAKPTNAATRNTALRRIAVILAAKGGTIADITVGDCLEVVAAVASASRRGDTSLYFYQLLHAAGTFAPDAPPTVRIFAAPGQQSVEQLIDRYDFACGPIRDAMVAYLRERQPALDYTSLRNVSFALGKMFWKDLEVHHPGIDSLCLAPDVTALWKQRVAHKTTAVTDAAGRRSRVQTARSDRGINYLAIVRAFYLDIAQWAMTDPAVWGRWAAPCPIRAEEMSLRKVRSRRKSRMDQRTRERLPVLPVLVATLNQTRRDTAERLEVAQRTAPGELFTGGGVTLRRSALGSRTQATRVWAEDPLSAKRRDLTLEEHRGFWAWAVVEVLRHTGIRIEELTELSHHSFIQYRLPTTGELVPLLQIAPSKSDTERLLVISPELAEVLSAIVRRVRDSTGAVPLVVSYDIHERVWNQPMPLLFQRRYGTESREITAGSIRKLLIAALAGTGLIGIDNRPLHFVPHDFRRLFITDAILNGMPPHIAQLVCGHKDINTTMGYKAVYPEEVISGHRSFIARRRGLRPAAEYRTPTDEEWEEFLGHFERRKVALGTCGRAFGTPCIHEHACLRCPLLRPDPAQRHRLVDICDNLTARIKEAGQQGWLGEVEGLQISLAGARHKLSQLDEQTARAGTTTDLGMPNFSRVVGRNIITGGHQQP